MLARLSAQSNTKPDASTRRALLVAALIVLWMLAIGVRLVYLQVSQHDDLVERARRQQQETLPINSQRGVLLDRDQRELARSVDTDSIFIAPDEITELDGVRATADNLATVLGLDSKSLLTRLQEAKNSGRRFIWIARRLTPEQSEKIKELKMPGVHTRKEPKRYYPNGSLAAHILGFVGLDGVGLGGVEQTYDETVMGEPGKVFLERDSNGNAYESFEVPAKAGQSIVLTIDQSIQYRAEQSLANAIQQTRAKSGTAIVLDPRTGEILALANAPTFDPNSVETAKPEVRSNWALQNVYEPGSTFKIIAFSAAIEKGLFTPDARIDCQMGSITVAGRVIHDHHSFGTLTISEALAKSSNVAAIKLALRVGNESMYDYITRFGFGSRTGIELPGETPGLLRPVKRWQASSIGSIAIGQEIGITPLQMASAFGALANDGVRVAPHLVREIRTPSGITVYRSNPEQRRVIGAATAQSLRRMLEAVTVSGTAKLAQLNGYTAAGKTGTAQKVDPKTRTYSATKHVASFVGFAPVENPAVVIIVVIDEPAGAYHGGDVAAPVFRDIAELVLPNLGVAPDTEIKATPGWIAQSTPGPQQAEANSEVAQTTVDEARRATLPTVSRGGSGKGEVVYAVANHQGMLMPDLRGQSVRDVARACAQLGLQLEARGEGRVTRHSPAPGSEVEPGQMIFVDFERSN